MQKITSTSNERIKFLKTLKMKKGREESGCYLIEGKRAVTDAVKHNVAFECLLIEEGKEFDIEPNCEKIIVSSHIIELLSETSSPEGIIAQARKFSTEFDANDLNGLVVFLDTLQDAGNLGTIIRTADAAGASAVILSENCVELFNPKVIRATMSSVFNIKIMVTDDKISALQELKNKGYTLYSAALNGENFYDTEIEKEKNNCIIIGNEGNGISKEVLSVSDKIITLPMRGDAESLNAGIAAGILIYGFTFNK